jgi:hypothetical protein
MAEACDRWLQELEKKVNARLAELNPVDGRYAISKCQVYADFNDVDQFSKFKGGRIEDERNKAWDKSQIKAESDKVEGYRDDNDNQQKCQQAIRELTDENINNWINNYFAEINVASQGVPPGCDEDVATAQAKAAQEKAEEEVLVRRRKCPGRADIRSSTQECRDLALAEANLKQRSDAVAAATLESLSGRSQSVSFKEQCFLLGEIYGIARRKEELDEFVTDLVQDPPQPKSAWRKELKPLPYPNGINEEGKNASLTVQGDPFAFINKLTQNFKDRRHFFEMTPAQISNLQPMIRLFKVIENKDKPGVEDEVEMQFDTHLTQTDLTQYFKNSYSRGTGVGIKDFVISYEAENPFSITKSIRAKLTLHALSFDDLLRERVGPNNEKYSYIDLALKTGGESTYNKIRQLQHNQANNKIDSKSLEAIENLQKLLFRLKAVVGWALPTGNLAGIIDGNGPTESELKTAIDQSCISINLTPTVHEFNFDESGRVDFVINYLAYVEDFFDQPKFNIFSDQEVAARQLVRNLQVKKWNKQCKADEVAKLRKDQKEQVEEDRQQAMRTLVKQAMDSGKICYITMPFADMSAYDRDGPLLADSGIYDSYLDQITEGPTAPPLSSAATPNAADAQALIEEAKEAMIASINEGATASELPPLDALQTISFIYLGDLIDIILENIGGLLNEMAIGTLIDEALGIQNAPGIEGIPLLTAPGARDPLPTDSSEFYTEAEIQKNNYKRYLENFKRYRLVLGPLELNNASKGGEVVESKFVSLSDVPISLRYFLEWLTNKMLKKQEVNYPLTKFTNDLINELLRNFLNNDECFNNEARQSTRLGQSALTAYMSEDNGIDEISEALANQYDKLPSEPPRVPRRLRMSLVEPNDTPVLSVNGNRDVAIQNPGKAKEINYMVYYASRVQPVELMNGDYDEDHDRGVWHYGIGRDRGIVKNIQLKRTNSPGLKEVRFEQEGYDGLRQLREVYDVTIDCYSDVSAFPGNYIYVAPGSFSPGAASNGIDLTQFGIGGYYMIIRSEHSYGPGRAETIITAKWVAQVEKATAIGIDGEEESSSNKCPADSAGSDRSVSETNSITDAVMGFLGLDIPTEPTP